MKRKNRILALIDFSEYADSVIHFASAVSSLIKAEVVFIHQVLAPVPALADIDSKAEIVSFSKEEAMKKLKLLTQQHVFFRSSYLVSEKSVLSILNELKSEEHFDWVFVGLKGTGIVKQIFMGSTTLKIVDESDFLSVAIPAKISVDAPKKLVVAIHSKYPVNNSQFNELLLNLSPTLEQLEFFSIVTEDEDEMQAVEYLNTLQEQYKQYNPTVKFFKSNDVFSEVHRYMKGKNDVFLVVQQGSRALTDSMFREFMINELVYNGSIPLIILSK